MQSCPNPLPDQLKSIWTSNGLPEEFLSNLTLLGDPDASVPSSFRVGLAAQISVALAGLSAAYLHYLSTGITQSVIVDARHAALAFHSEAWYTVDDALPAGDVWDNIAGLYKTADGGYVRIHTNFPHHRAGVLNILGIPDTPEHRATRADVAPAILCWDAGALEDACAERGMCVFKLRSQDEWDQTPQAQALAGAPVVDVRRVGGAPRMCWERGKARPLAGVKVLDLSRVLAGPVAGRTLAAHGAQVLLITSPTLPSLPLLDTDTALGKRTVQLDLAAASDRDRFRDLVKDADVFLQAYRPGGIEKKGFGVADVIRIKEEEGGGEAALGVVYASLRAWGWDGPWAGRRGFDSLVQTATGFNADEGAAYHAFLVSEGRGRESAWAPRTLPMQALDHAAGYLLAFGVNVALARALQEGGSHEVRVSLAGVGSWVRSLGRIAPEAAFGARARALPPRMAPLDPEIARLSVVWRERRGIEHLQGDVRRRRMTALRHPALLTATPVREGVLEGEDAEEEDDWGAPMRLDADGPVWI